MPNQAREPRGPLLTTLAVAMGLMAVSNLTKPISQTLAPESTAGFVFFGHRLYGLANAIVGPLFGLLLAAYSYGVWTMRSWVLPIAWAYAGYVILNLVLFSLNPPPGSDLSMAFIVAYAVVAIGVSSSGAYLLLQSRDRLR